MDNYNVNNKLFSFSGVINRRNYIVNILLIETIIQSLFATPLLIMAFKMQSLSGAILGGGSMPKWWDLTLCFLSVATNIMYMPSITRRIRDISGFSGKDNVKTYSVIVFLLLIFGIPSVVSQNLLFTFLKLAGFTTIIYLACIKGSITGNEPKSEVAKFNWGAFVGTWIWGIFNKSYFTLLALPLSFTFGALPFSVVCGLKGNEWAFEKSSDKNVELFHSRQKIQTAIFTIIMPILFFFMFIFASVSLYRFANNYAKEHPAFIEQSIEYYVNTESKAALSRFDKIELTEDEYKFYINPKKWSGTTKRQKISDMDMAANYVILGKLDKNNMIKSFASLSSGKILCKIKIYSTFNNELLGEYALSEEELTKLLNDSKSNPELRTELLSKIKNGYSFNERPSLP